MIVSSEDLTFTQFYRLQLQLLLVIVLIGIGVTYDSTGMYTNVYTGVNGCDSIVTLDLTIVKIHLLQF